MSGSAILDLARRWEGEASTLRDWGAVTRAVALERCAAELRGEVNEWESERLSQVDAAAEIGVSPSTLRRWTHEGKVVRQPDGAYVRQHVYAALRGEVVDDDSSRGRLVRSRE